MPRPCKQRRICAVPGCRRFGPKETIPEADRESPAVIMTLDEFETIRLIDLEGMTQEQCAAQMDIARTTVQAIYNSARQKLAACLVHGQELAIRGGNYVLCGGNRESCRCLQPCGTCRRDAAESMHGNSSERRRKQIMRIAVTYENGEVFQHFGHTEQFKLYDVEGTTITSSSIVDTNGTGHGALAGLLHDWKVDVLICGGIGGGAQAALAEAGVQLYGAVTGSADNAVAALLAGNLSFDPNASCNHHGEHHHGEGSCHDHAAGSCGHHGNGGSCH